MADWDFARATTWTELADEHARRVGNDNEQFHGAHRQRTDGRETPRTVLGWVSGEECTPQELHRVFYRTRFGRKLDRLGGGPLGGMRFRHWRLYGEHGLAGEGIAIWLYEESLTVEFADEALAQYRVRYQSDRKHFTAIEAPRLFATPHQSPQFALWALGEGEWLKVLRLEA